MSAAGSFITPDWPAPGNVQARVTTRGAGAAGRGEGPYAGLNLAAHVGDSRDRVILNRRRLCEALGLQREPQWLAQMHGAEVVVAGRCETDAQADAAVCFEPGPICAVLTADCVPAFFCDRNGTRVGLAHAGWRGLSAGVLEATVSALDRVPADILAWLGPAIGPRAFRVGDEVRDLFVRDDSPCFLPDGRGQWMADIYLLARRRLERMSVGFIGGGVFCTYHDQRFYSCRRSRITGRMASLIWLSE